VIQFLEKEIKTYTALALFLSKEGVRGREPRGDRGLSLKPAFYTDRMKEANKLVNELRKPI
jgi:hypothetical protein